MSHSPTLALSLSKRALPIQGKCFDKLSPNGNE
ncbi:hypothetical protein BV98_000843 [Sphingobium herbicidovorans NBRC 16415]|uniref:Uncharacterized protein n=1 Tax=Sphingobium herbicidovorans (strain ATCC 700291 / DSM 11019 / CCUG 56400 / KCTC 2939 / LMG 18315 / NBRC 16415 / MH) TaxID=1219045 RepID=A0A086PD84_SPHHM|nr:hypothetical protein BV98_000843 [Sphingobium herbicidovorans NBRC 16415]